jgi:hypothetical protein
VADSEREKYTEWCFEEANGRVDSIVKGQHRKSYHKASTIIVSLAELMRSNGDKANAEKFIMMYKNRYPRHSSFITCLREDAELAKFSKLV